MLFFKNKKLGSFRSPVSRRKFSGFLVDYTARNRSLSKLLRLSKSVFSPVKWDRGLSRELNMKKYVKHVAL